MTKKETKTEIDPALIDEALRATEGDETSDEIVERSPSLVTQAPTPEDHEQKYKETYDRLVRLTADFDNFRKRTQKEKADLVLYGNENLVREILPVVDNFERAVEHARKSTDVESIRTGVELILSQLQGVLERFGIRPQNAKGEVFDPLIHEAVSHIESEEHKPNTVMEEHQKAYFLHQRLVRPALVTVARAPDGQLKAPNVESQVSDEKKN
jgi:molecular chaperone GrpE